MARQEYLRWRKSSWSGNNNGACLEVASQPWRKSSRSGNTGGECVELAVSQGNCVLVRDSKLGDASPILAFSSENWLSFVKALR